MSTQLPGHSKSVAQKWSTPIFWLRLSYRTGAVIDAIAALLMLFPGLFATLNQLPDFHPGVPYQYAMDMGASLMFGWTALLIWADRKPFERKGILPLTVLVILGLAANEIWAVSSQFLSLGAVAPIWVLQTALVVLFAFSYRQAKEN